MSEAELIERPAAGAERAQAAPLTIKATILAQYAAIEPDILALADRYRDVAYAVTTPKGLAEAKAARHELRERGRFMLNRALEAKKRDLNDGKALLTAETERLVAVIRPVEDAIDAQVTAEESRQAEAKAERERVAAEEARVAAERRTKFEGEIAKIRDCAVRAKGLPSERIAKGITAVDAIAIDEETWAEFAPAASIAQAETLVAMRELLAEAQAAEKAAAEAKAQREELERQAAEVALQRTRMAGIQWFADRVTVAKSLVGEQDAIEDIDYLTRQVDEVEARPVTVEASGDMLSMAEMAKTLSLQQLRAMLAEAQARAEREMAERASRAAYEAAQREEAAPEPDTANHDMVDDMAGIVAPVSNPARWEDGTSPTESLAELDTYVEAMASEPEKYRVELPYIGPFDDLQPVDETAGQGFTPDVLADLLAHIAKLDEMKFPSHPKPPQEWFAELRRLASEVQS